MPRQQRSCPNTKFQMYRQSGRDNIILHSFFRLKRGKRRRYRCTVCGKTFCSTTGTVYHRIHRSRNTFDEVCCLSVEGVSKSAIARVKKLSWNTVSRWLERAAQAAKQFSKHRLRGFAPYEWVIRRMFGPVCIYGQVIKARRKNRVVSIDRKLLIGSREQLEDALYRSEDSDTLNTSFVERHNLTIRQGCLYLHRRTTAHARWPHRLQEHLELLQCHYNFIRPHMAMQFGTIRRTPAMQAGLTSKSLTFRQIFTSRVLVIFVIWAWNQLILTNQRKAA